MAGTPDHRRSAARGEGAVATDASLPPSAIDETVREAEEKKWTPGKIALWAAIALLGGVAWFML
ncbi:MAG: carbon starvation protein predicted rane protein, partial [Pseudarthrobacter sp.]|nr:carbon starvation protein predicted rane protein [Pseudarthrobacter sp.]